MRGVGINKALEKIEIDRYSDAGKDVTCQLIDTVNTFRSYEASLPKKGSWLRYDDVDFSSVRDGYLVINVKANDNTQFTIRENTPKGKVIANIQMTVKSENGPFRRDRSNQWLTPTAPLEYTPKGVTNLCVVCEGPGISVDWLQVKNRPAYFSPANSNPMQPGY